MGSLIPDRGPVQPLDHLRHGCGAILAAASALGGAILVGAFLFYPGVLPAVGALAFILAGLGSKALIERNLRFWEWGAKKGH